MFGKFYPTYEVDSVYEIPYQELYKNGCRGVIYDIDNTLTEHDAPATSEIVSLLDKLKEMGYQICLLSNNKEERVQLFNKDVQVKYIHKAGKPSVKGYERAMELMGCDRTNTIFVGDQLFTDVYGGNRTGIPTYLVKPIAKHEEIQIVLKRYLERIVLYFYHKKLTQSTGEK